MDILSMFLLTFLLILSFIIGYLLIIKSKEQKNKQILQTKIFELENKITDLNLNMTKNDNIINVNVDKVIKKNNKKPNDNMEELFNLRKDISKYKDENKKIKNEICEKDKKIAEYNEKIENETYKLQEENSVLLVQLKELTNKLNENNKNLQLDKEKLLLEYNNKTFKIENEYKEYKILNENLENKINKYEEVLNNLQNKNQELTQENKKIKELLEHLEGSQTNLEELVKWKSRANKARDMYRMMQQLRNLSDEKILSYQEYIIMLSEWIFNKLSINHPNVADNEVKADRYLAEAIGLTNFNKI